MQQFRGCASAHATNAPLLHLPVWIDRVAVTAAAEPQAHPAKCCARAKSSASRAPELRARALDHNPRQNKG
jgi:hypothetical protein|tara:strand:+ start:2079 stop:2291 length:213 start_codon:yes stop_codon:yes gene_type:complete